jgi:hypothetical protein
MRSPLKKISTDRQGTARQVKRAFTNLSKPDDFLQHAGRCVFHMRDLVALVGVVERLARRRPVATES